MPNRILRPWTDSEAVNSLSDAAEVFFVRLIQCADDYGRFYGTPMLLKSYLFPLKDKRVADISRWIAECAKAGLIADYEVSGKRFIEIRNFKQQTRSKSKFPSPPSGHIANAKQMLSKCSADAKQLRTIDGDGDVKENISLAGDTKESAPAFDFPHSVDEVIALSQNPLCGMPCSLEQAEAYFTDRVSRDWIPYGQQRQIRNQTQLAADLKKWLMRDLNNERERKAKNANDSRHYTNDASQYDAADDGSNI